MDWKTRRAAAVMVVLMPLMAPPPALSGDGKPGEPENRKTTYRLAANPASGHEISAEPEYRMTTYYVGFLSRGENWTGEETEELQMLQAAHLAHIGGMADSGKLLLAGPFLHDGDLRGLFVFKTATIEEATRMASADPMVKAGHLAIKILPWYSAEGIQIVQDGLHEHE